MLALVKLFITTLCLTTGWKGGYIFPAMFAGAALGMAAHLSFPVILEAVAATMAGMMVAMMKVPISSGLFVMVPVQTETAPVIAIAVIVAVGGEVFVNVTVRGAVPVTGDTLKSAIGATGPMYVLRRDSKASKYSVPDVPLSKPPAAPRRTSSRRSVSLS